MKRILITGGDGFLAKSFYEKLLGDYEIISCNRLLLDLNDSTAVLAYLKMGNFDVIIHTATYDAAPQYSLKDKNKVLENNLRMFFNIVRCDGYFGKLIYFGSGAEFNRKQWKPKMKESYFDQHVPVDQYGYSKYIMTKHALLNSNIVNLRLFGVFGEYDDWRYRFIPNACCYAVNELSINIHRNSRVDFLYIDDLVKVVQWAIDNKPKRSVYNVCSGEVFDSIELAKKIILISGKDLDFYVESEGQGEYSGDNSILLKEMINFECTPMEKSLASLFSWYEKNKQIIDVSQFHF